MPKQHANATTTPEMRAFIHESDLPTAVLARLLKISESTVRKWRQRESMSDASHVPKQLNTTLSEAQEYVVVELRTRLLLSLDELLVVCKQFINSHVSRAGLQRCLKRHGVSRLADMEDSGEFVDADNPLSSPVQVTLEDTLEHQVLLSDISPKAMREVLNRTNHLSEDEVVQVKVTQLPDFSNKNTEQGAEKGSTKGSTKDSEQQNKRRLLVANDPTSGWVYVDIYDGNEADAASRYMSYVLTKAPFHIRRILAGNYTEFLSRFRLLNNVANNATNTTVDEKTHQGDIDNCERENATKS
ncbi:MAG: transcriptional regulator [Gammaproteobacteria bacterium]|jgi:transposase-like protein|nr:MAG: transcriptional regulator [Gammaproteobacteria bacterium]PHR84496.1 MAG: transcriptional regulator [Colwellia sp.]